MKRILDSVQQQLPDLGFTMKKSLLFLFLRGLFLAISSLLYFCLYNFLPLELAAKMHIILILSLIIIIFILLPLQEKWESWVLKTFLSEFFVEDDNEIQVAGRVVRLKWLVSRVFPDMLKIANSKSGRIYFLSKSKEFEAYGFIDGRVRKIKHQSVYVDPRLIDYLKSNKSPINFSQAEKNNWLKEYLSNLKAEFILPLVYREKIFGFVTMGSIPPQNQIFNLKLLASKAAISVYNNILSTQVADLNLYKKEIEKADRIQGMVFQTRIPRLDTINIKQINQVSDIILEFIPGENGEYVMIAIALKNPKFGGGLILSHILGKLYTFFIVKKNLNYKMIKEFVEEGFEEQKWKDGYEMVVGIFQPQTGKIIFNQVGNYFKITNNTEEGNLISVGWRYTLDIKETILYLFYKNTKILSIRDSQTV